MKIKYVTRSRFLLPCKAAIHKIATKLQSGGSVSVNLPSGGYDGDVNVNLAGSNSQTFESNWNNTDPSRFPARIKAAATALKDLGYVGRYRITHSEGVLTIRQA